MVTWDAISQTGFWVGHLHWNWMPASLEYTPAVRHGLAGSQAAGIRGQIYFPQIRPFNSTRNGCLLLLLHLPWAKPVPDHRTSKPRLLAPLPTTASESAGFAAFPSSSIVSLPLAEPASMRLRHARSPRKSLAREVGGGPLSYP